MVQEYFSAWKHYCLCYPVKKRLNIRVRNIANLGSESVHKGSVISIHYYIFDVFLVGYEFFIYSYEVFSIFNFDYCQLDGNKV